MADRIDAATINHSTISKVAQILERIGLAIIRALCGLFVAALVAKANIEEIDSLGILFSVIIFGSIGFYLRTSVPSLSSSASRGGPTPVRGREQTRSRWQVPPAHSLPPL